ncbi:glycogen synthase GlgA [Kaistia dalseonensis]|uniref:Glycogen synthase n=1 Tax=Kaistia dalseonensis TaxID=410840 RepID=A0ABU0H8D7_9HYPH|nr:glycogen synthase GlgA [Kaistia dalseonensis]MCX5495969.1 glycogen synthase GlgA [Kaistia dalseonensis]MDQ0438572.1 starch synthase [Kaistia dalseonensis]
MKALKVLSVASEIYPFVKTGGLADVVGALPAALASEGVAVTTLVPGYPAVMAAVESSTEVYHYADLFGVEARLVRATVQGLDLLVLDAPRFFDRAGNPYLGADGQDWHDNPQRFAALSRVAADLGLGRAPLYVPDVVHTHDWQTGLTAAYLHYSGEPHAPTVMTVHNLAFQGQFSPSLLSAIGLPPYAFGMDGVEYYGTIGYLKAGLQLSDRITTVSPTYAAEIRTPEGGMGFDGLLRSRAAVVSGILNGIDTTTWDPATDPLIAAPFDLKRIEARAANKAALQERLGLAIDPDAQLFGVVSRLTWQKGLDLLVDRLGILLGTGAQLAILGSGDATIAEGLAYATVLNPGRVAMVNGYNEGLAHQIQAGSDVILVPSRFEPCGLTQLCALRYGAIPLVARVGGLADTIIDANEVARAAGIGTGIQFGSVTPAGLEAAILRAAELWRDKPYWQAMQKNAMKTDVSWSRPAATYAALYRSMVAIPQ